MAEFERVIGAEWSFTSDTDLELHRDAYSPLRGKPEELLAAAALAPDSTENALSVKYQGVKSGVIREWIDLTPELVRFWACNGVSVMAPFRKTEISDTELSVLARYLAQGTSSHR